MTKNICHSFPILDLIIRIEIMAYKNEIKIFNHLFNCGFRIMEKNIIKAGIIKITEKITSSLGVVVPIGV